MFSKTILTKHTYICKRNVTKAICCCLLFYALKKYSNVKKITSTEILRLRAFDEIVPF